MDSGVGDLVESAFTGSSSITNYLRINSLDKMQLKLKLTIKFLFQLADKVFVVDVALRPDVDDTLNVLLDRVVADEADRLHQTVSERVLEDARILSLAILDDVVGQVEEGQPLLADHSYNNNNCLLWFFSIEICGFYLQSLSFFNHRRHMVSWLFLW